MRVPIVPRGVTLLEVCIAVVVLSLAFVPIIGLMTGGRSQASMSEHQIYAELACYRAQKDIATRHFGWLFRENVNYNIFQKLQDIDRGDAESEGGRWKTKMPEFEQNAWKAIVPIKGKVVSEPVGAESGKAIQCIKVSATWSDLKSGSRGEKEYSYHMLRLRAKRDFGLRYQDASL
jgi:Tfp pilus assembly protein PilV